jgi:16S rRNA G1207 methylase RsmC
MEEIFSNTNIVNKEKGYLVIESKKIWKLSYNPLD